MPHPERHSEARRSLQPGEGSGAHHRCRVPPTSVFPSEPALLHAPSVIPKPGVFSSRARDLACTTDDECPNVCSPQRSLRCCTPRASSRSPAFSPAGRGIWRAAPQMECPGPQARAPFSTLDTAMFRCWALTRQKSPTAPNRSRSRSELLPTAPHKKRRAV